MLATFSSARNVCCCSLMALSRAYTKSCKMEAPCRPCEPGCNKHHSECETVIEDPCNPQKKCCGSSRLAKDPCFQRRSQSKDRSRGINPNALPPESIWEYPADCCGNPCPELLPRFDTLYYRVSDKDKRCYQQTWVDCKVIKRIKERFCHYDPDTLPPIYFRAPVRCPDTACEYDALKMKELCCLSLPTQCARAKMPCCRPVRHPPFCFPPRAPKICEKRCCPYPSYSECCHPCIQRSRFRECNCLRVRHKCEGYAYLRRKKMYGLPPNLPEWPPRLIGPRY